MDAFFPCSIGRPTKLLLFKYLPWTVVPVTWHVGMSKWYPRLAGFPLTWLILWLLPMRNSPPPWRGFDGEIRDCNMFICKITTNQCEYAHDFIMQSLQNLSLSITQNNTHQRSKTCWLSSFQQASPWRHPRNERMIMPYRCLPPFRTSHFTGDVTAIGNDTQTGSVVDCQRT